MNTTGPASRNVFHPTPRSAAIGNLEYSSRGRWNVPGWLSPRVLMRSDLRLSVCFSCLGRRRPPTQPRPYLKLFRYRFGWHTNIACVAKGHESGWGECDGSTRRPRSVNDLLDFIDRLIYLSICQVPSGYCPKPSRREPCEGSTRKVQMRRPCPVLRRRSRPVSNRRVGLFDARRARGEARG